MNPPSHPPDVIHMVFEANLSLLFFHSLLPLQTKEEDQLVLPLIHCTLLCWDTLSAITTHMSLFYRNGLVRAERNLIVETWGKQSEQGFSPWGTDFNGVGERNNVNGGPTSSQEGLIAISEERSLMFCYVCPASGIRMAALALCIWKMAGEHSVRRRRWSPLNPYLPFWRSGWPSSLAGQLNTRSWPSTDSSHCTLYVHVWICDCSIGGLQ